MWALFLVFFLMEIWGFFFFFFFFFALTIKIIALELGIELI
jgi:hypothetical protein